jgi:hypothetical protein
MTTTETAQRAIELADQIARLSEELEALKAQLRVEARAALGHAPGVWTVPDLPAPYTGRVTVTVPTPPLTTADNISPTEMLKLIGPEAYRDYFEERIKVVPKRDFRERVLTAREPLRSALMGLIEVGAGTARVSFTTTPARREGQ